MKIIIEAEAKEIAALVLAAQGQQADCQSQDTEGTEEISQRMVKTLEGKPLNRVFERLMVNNVNPQDDILYEKEL